MLENNVPEDLKLEPSCEEEPESDDELILTPTPEEEKKESDELILEADDIAELEEITFDGELESEIRIEEAMKAYDETMDKAAGLIKK